MKAKTLLTEMANHPLFSELQVGVFEWNEKEDVVGQFFPQDTPITLRRNFVNYINTEINIIEDYES